jgi:hypothetical protein
MHGLQAENHAQTTCGGTVKYQYRPRNSILDGESSRRLEGREPLF